MLIDVRARRGVLPAQPTRTHRALDSVIAVHFSKIDQLSSRGSGHDRLPQAGPRPSRASRSGVARLALLAMPAPLTRVDFEAARSSSETGEAHFEAGFRRTSGTVSKVNRATRGATPVQVTASVGEPRPGPTGPAS